MRIGLGLVYGWFGLVLGWRVLFRFWGSSGSGCQGGLALWLVWLRAGGGVLVEG